VALLIVGECCVDEEPAVETRRHPVLATPAGVKGTPEQTRDQANTPMLVGPFSAESAAQNAARASMSPFNPVLADIWSVCRHPGPGVDGESLLWLGRLIT
jgi:hypothetical protein